MSINSYPTSAPPRPRAGDLGPNSRYAQFWESHEPGFARQTYDRPKSEPIHPLVEIQPSDNVKRDMMESHGLVAELIRLMGEDRVEIRFRAPVHLLVMYEQGARREGETFVEGLPKSTLRDLARKLTFVPAGHEFIEWQEPRTPTRLMCFYFDPVNLQVHSELGITDKPLAPRLFFEDATLLGTALKLKRLTEYPTSENRRYFDALGVVLAHELVRHNHGAPRVDSQVRGGLAAWQQRIVVAYIEEHLSEPIPLATLAQLVRLSPYYFCRAFKQSFGMPPHRYHTSRRIEQAKALLAKRTISVTEIGLAIGFSETSSFTAAFRRATGFTPSRYHRNVG